MHTYNIKEYIPATRFHDWQSDCIRLSFRTQSGVLVVPNRKELELLYRRNCLASISLVPKALRKLSKDLIAECLESKVAPRKPKHKSIGTALVYRLDKSSGDLKKLTLIRYTVKVYAQFFAFGEAFIIVKLPKKTGFHVYHEETGFTIRISARDLDQCHIDAEKFLNSKGKEALYQGIFDTIKLITNSEIREEITA